MKTIGLCMIVKNESKVILRCLESVRPIVDYVLVEDTGSTDGTPDLIRGWLDRGGLPGEVYSEPWRDFAYNRSHALAKLREKKDLDYALVMDADDVMVFKEGFDPLLFKKSLHKDGYDVTITRFDVKYFRKQICSNRLKFKYRGVLHEFLEEPSRRCSSGIAKGFYIDSSGQGGARSEDPEKYRKDAQILEEALRTEQDFPLRARYTFYLAQTYGGCGEDEKALKAYLARSKMGFWDQEIYWSLYRAAQYQAAFGRPLDEVLSIYAKASKACPARAEAMHDASRLCRLNNRFEEGYQLAKRGLAIPQPANALFTVPWIYEYGLLDELAVNAYWTERYQDCLEACRRLFREGKMPPEMHERVKKNADFAAEKLTKPTVGTKTIGLSMIVKNESSVILRCLQSVRPLVDYVLIEDTGSTDGTQEIIRKYLKHENLPGELFDEPWQDFARNRSLALARLREKRDVDYVLIMDADDVLVFDAGFDPKSFKEDLFHDFYHVRIQYGPAWYSRAQICSNRRELRYRGVLHEFIEAVDVGCSSGTATGLHIRIGSEGARSQDPNKYRKDVQVLEQALQTEQDPFLRSRYTFYLAQSYRDAGEREKALENYLRRSELGYWIDEVFMSLYYAAQLKEAIGHPFEDVLATYLRAADMAPGRAETLHAASRLCREKGKFACGYEYARRGLAIPAPVDGLFVEKWIYEYGLLDELAVNAYWTEQYQDCLEACQRLLREGKMLPDMHNRVQKNAEFATEKIMTQGVSRMVGERPNKGAPSPSIEELIGLSKKTINVADIGAAFFGQRAPYQALLDSGLAKLFAFELDEREIETLQQHLGQRGQVIPYAVGDGRSHVFHICSKRTGMSSLLEPDPGNLAFFNLFTDFGKVISTAVVSTRRLDDIVELPQLDFCKMDCQGSELMVLANGRKKLSECVAIQTEISFITLYRNQPTFADIDHELRYQGFIPHCFTHVKRWSISPIVCNNEPRQPFNQLLEADIVYVRNIIHSDEMGDLQLKKLAAIAHISYGSPDLAARCILEMENRRICDVGTVTQYLKLFGGALGSLSKTRVQNTIS